MAHRRAHGHGGARDGGNAFAAAAASNDAMCRFIAEAQDCGKRFNHLCPVRVVSEPRASRLSSPAQHLHDLARNDSRNEYFAGGQDEEGRGSATVLIYPDEEEVNTTATAEPVKEEPTSRMTGSGRKL